MEIGKKEECSSCHRNRRIVMKALSGLRLCSSCAFFMRMRTNSQWYGFKKKGREKTFRPKNKVLNKFYPIEK